MNPDSNPGADRVAGMWRSHSYDKKPKTAPEKIMLGLVYWLDASPEAIAEARQCEHLTDIVEINKEIYRLTASLAKCQAERDDLLQMVKGAVTHVEDEVERKVYLRDISAIEGEKNDK